MSKKIWLYIFLFFCLILNLVIDFNINKYINILNICFKRNIILTIQEYISICSINALIFVFAIIDILLVALKRKKENEGIKFKNNDGTHGTAKWMEEKEMKEILGINEVPGIILGKYNGNIIKLPFDSYFNKNICTFGITNLLELSKYKKSIVVTDPKAEIYRKTSKYFKEIGYTVKVFNLKDMKHSDRWNPSRRK